MALVAYSDSEGSEDENPQPKPVADKATSKTPAPSTSNFSVNKANPRKIQVKLNDAPTMEVNGDEPARKRPRLGAGGGAFSGFNAMLPAPKRDAEVKNGPTPTTRKVFSLKTGAEPGFSREADAELRQLFAEQNQQNGDTAGEMDSTIPSIPKRTTPSAKTEAEKPLQGNPFMFKPLSVARNKKKITRKTGTLHAAGPGELDTKPQTSDTKSKMSQTSEPVPVPKKANLFSINVDSEPPAEPAVDDDNNEDEIVEVLEEPWDQPTTEQTVDNPFGQQPQSLDSIAASLKLSKSARRQLLGRKGEARGTSTAVNVINFNTDQEYAANEILRANGEQVQHNPVRAIAPGKHSLKQLVSAATGQKEALEESFATGRRNKREAGNKYGW
jgi:hypothetical protein